MGLVRQPLPKPSEADIQQLIDVAQDYRMTEAEKKAQMISFAYGNCKMSNPDITREEVAAAYDEMFQS